MHARPHTHAHTNRQIIKMKFAEEQLGFKYVEVYATKLKVSWRKIAIKNTSSI